jgi:hypothetical protein
MYIFLIVKGLGYIFSDFFANPSCHPGPKGPVSVNRNLIFLIAAVCKKTVSVCIRTDFI